MLIVSALVAVKINVATYFFNFVYLALLAAAAAEYSGQLLSGQGFVTKYLGDPQCYSKYVKDTLLPAIGNTFDCFEKKTIDIVYVKDLEKTLKAAGVAYILHKITAYFSVYALVWVGVIFMFSVPPFYQAHQGEIDATFARFKTCAAAQAKQLATCAKCKLGPWLDQVIEKTGPVGNFIQSKFPTRTAGSTVCGARADKTAAEPSSGISSGASKFPDTPVTELKSAVKEVNEDAPIAEFS